MRLSDNSQTRGQQASHATRVMKSTPPALHQQTEGLTCYTANLPSGPHHKMGWEVKPWQGLSQRSFRFRPAHFMKGVLNAVTDDSLHVMKGVLRWSPIGWVHPRGSRCFADVLYRSYRSRSVADKILYSLMSFGGHTSITTCAYSL